MFLKIHGISCQNWLVIINKNNIYQIITFKMNYSKKVATLVLILNESVYIYLSMINLIQLDKESIMYNIVGSIFMIISFVRQCLLEIY